MGVSMSTNLRNYTKALYGFDAVVQRVPEDRWDADSPCDGWSARDVVTHACGDGALPRPDRARPSR